MKTALFFGERTNGQKSWKFIMIGPQTIQI